MQDFTCNEVLLQCGISIFTKVKDMNTSSTTTKTLATVKKGRKTEEEDGLLTETSIFQTAASF